MLPTVAIIILNWNGWRDTIECLGSVRQLTYPNFWTVVVDNGSTDDSLQRLRDFCAGRQRIESGFMQGKDSGSQPVELHEYAGEEVLGLFERDKLTSSVASGARLVLIKNKNNLGFAEGNSVGIGFALDAVDADYVFLQNNDTVVDPRLLDELVSVAQSASNIGVVGPKMYYYDFGGRRDVLLYVGARIVPWREIVYKHLGAGEVDSGQYDEDSETDWCSGAGMMISAKLYGHLKLNTSYRFGNEDAEYCMKARKLGWKVVYAHKAKMWHKVAASRGKLDTRVRRDILGYFRFIKSNFSAPVYAYHVLQFLLVMLPKWLFLYTVLADERRPLRDFFTEFKRLVG